MRKRYEDAGSDIMAYIARAALSQNKSQEWLAEQLGLKAGNVIGHFNSTHPRQSTIDAYAKILGIPDEVVRIKSGAGLTNEQLQEWWHRIALMVAQHSSDYERGTSEEVEKFLNGLPNARRGALVEAVTLATLTWELPSGASTAEWPLQKHISTPGMVALSHFLPRGLDLPKRLRIKRQNEDVLINIYRQLTSPKGPLNDGQADAIVNLVSVMLKTGGLDVDPMLDHYHRERDSLHRQLKQLEKHYTKRLKQKRKAKS
jgi:hypothetical protein